MEGNKAEVMKKPWWYISVLILIFLILKITGCSAPKIMPYSEPVTLETKELENGSKLFDHHCASCHPGGMSGLGPAIINKPLPEFLIRFQIRNGIGVMPAFKKDVLDDEQVENIAEYLVYLRKKD